MIDKANLHRYNIDVEYEDVVPDPYANYDIDVQNEDTDALGHPRGGLLPEAQLR